MPLRLIFPEPAYDDLAAIRAYIARDSVEAADVVVIRVLDAIDRLIDMPRASAIVAEFDRADLRQVRVYDYRIIFRTFPDAVRVVGIVHTSRDLFAAIGKRL